VRRWLFSIALFATAAAAQPNGLLLVAKPGLADPNFRETVVLVTQTADSSTVGVILNRPTPRKRDQTGEPIYFGGPVMPEVLVALYAAERAPEAAAFHVLKDVYLTMHPQNIDALPGKRFRLFAGFAGWAPGQLQSELARDGWFVLPARAELLFRRDTRGMWDELVRKARGRVATR
jgi:putative transcriptional regulator